MPSPLEEHVAIITGAGAGIGEAGAHVFAAEGARVVVVDLLEDRVDAVVAGVHAAGHDALGVAADVADPEAMERVATETLERFGQIDVLWANAGIGRGVATPLEEITLEDWRAVMAVNVDGVFHSLRAVLPHMKARRSGAVVLTGSITALRAFYPGAAPYTASKGAVVSLTRLLALELAAFGIRVNCVAPGPVPTRIGDGVELPEGDAFQLGLPVPMPPAATDAVRHATPGEIARTALYLASPAAGPLTGVVLPHDGGITAF